MGILPELTEHIRAKTVVDIQVIMERFPNRSVPSFHRDLEKLHCVTSYTDNSRYYTLPDIPNYDGYGIWKYDNIRFSKNGTAKETARVLVCESSSGLSHTELKDIMGIRLYGSLKTLVHKKAIISVAVGNKLIFFSGDEIVSQRQKSCRSDMASAIISNPFNLTTVIEVLLAVFLEDKVNVEDAYRFLKSGKQPTITRMEVKEIFSYYKLPGKKN